jgi:hypothetical protein
MRIFFSGFASKRLLVSVFLLFLAGMVFGEKITVTPPSFTGDIPGIGIDAINQAAKDAFDELAIGLNATLDYLPDNFNNLAMGFANTSVFSSDGASQRGYKGFNTFSFTTGLVFALQAPPLSFFDKITGAFNNGEEGIGPDFIKDIVNIPFGIDGKLAAQLGINTSKFLLKGLYLGFKFSVLDSGWVIPSDFFYFKTMSVGINVNYQLISQKRLLAGLLIWRGLNLGTGFIWQNTSLDISPTLPEDFENVPIPMPIPGLEYINMPVKAAIHLGFETNTYIVPIEAITSIRLAWFLNLALGAGVDVALGSSKIDAYGSFNVDKDKVNNDLRSTGVEMDEAPSLKLSLGGKSGPGFFNPKAMFAVGFNFGPVIIDIPVTYYLMSNGYSLGISFGLTF